MFLHLLPNSFFFPSFGLEMLNWTVFFRVENLKSLSSSMSHFSFNGPIKCNTITSFSPLLFSLTYNSCNISLPRKLRRNVHVYGNSLSPISLQSSIHRNLYSEWQPGISLIAFNAKNSESGGEDNNKVLDAVMQSYSAFKDKNTQELSDILADECPRVSNFLSFFQAFQGKTVSFLPCLNKHILKQRLCYSHTHHSPIFLYHTQSPSILFCHIG